MDPLQYFACCSNNIYNLLYMLYSKGLTLRLKAINYKIFSELEILKILSKFSKIFHKESLCKSHKNRWKTFESIMEFRKMKAKSQYTSESKILRIFFFFLNPVTRFLVIVSPLKAIVSSKK